MYKKLLRPLLFLFSAETSHHLILAFLRVAYRIPGIRKLIGLGHRRLIPSLPVEAMGIEFPNPVGLAAGLDKDATCAIPLSDFGFGWIELGTVTPQPQKKNPGRVLFRLPEHAALINRMGFPSVGVELFLRNLNHYGKDSVIGINIGMNRNTPLERAAEDYLMVMRAVYPYADYIAVNVSSPNTANLRSMQKEQYLDDLLLQLKNEQIMLGKTRRHYVPLAVKVAPDLGDEDIEAISRLLLKHRIDGLIATNTTVTRPDVAETMAANENGGLSGRPLKSLSTEIIRKFYGQLKGEIPIIGVGGVENSADAWDKLMAGADLIQVYTGFIYEGPGAIRRIVRGLSRRVDSTGLGNLEKTLREARQGVHLMR